MKLRDMFGEWVTRSDDLDDGVDSSEPNRTSRYVGGIMCVFSGVSFFGLYFFKQLLGWIFKF